MRIRAALALGFLGIVVTGIGRVFGLIEMYVIGTGLFTTACSAVIWTRSRIVLIDVERHTSNREPRVGDDIEIDLTVKAVRRSPGFEFSDFIFDSDKSVMGRVDISVPPLRRGERTASRYRVRTEKRGVITLGPSRVTSGDPLGLSRRSTTTGGADDIVISPHWSPIALPIPRKCEGELVTAIESLVHNSASQQEFRSVREYIPGDHVRHVNWRATARRDSLIVNEFQSRSGVLLDVFLDDRDLLYSIDGFERAVSIAASFVGSANFVTDDDVRVRLSFGSGRDSTAFDAVIDDHTLHDAMRALALFETSDREPQPRARADRTSVSIPVIICGRRSADWLARVHKALKGSSISIVISCDGPAPAPPFGHGFTLQVDDFTSFEGQWARLSRRVETS